MYEQAHQVEERLAAAGIDYDDVVQTLEDEGVKKFEDSFAEMAKQVSDSLKAAGDGSV
jgi:transaldolase